jgi:hypothetical protein
MLLNVVTVLWNQERNVIMVHSILSPLIAVDQTVEERDVVMVFWTLEKSVIMVQ